MSRFATFLLAGALLGAGCTDPAMEQRVADLETKVQNLEAQVEQVKSAKGTAARPAGPSQEAETGANEVATNINQAMEDLDFAKAKELCTTLSGAEFRGTRAQRSMRKRCDEVAVVGIDAGELDGIEKWYVGNAKMNDGGATLLVFWEAWCPHCRKEVPKIQDTYAKYGGSGLNIIGLTRVTKSATDAKVEELIKENSVTYPMAKEGGELANRFGVRGIPAAAVVKDGKVVWRGHPARVTDEMISEWLK